MNFLLQSIPLLLYTHHARFVKSESLRTIHSIRQLRQGEVLPYITPFMFDGMGPFRVHWECHLQNYLSPIFNFICHHTGWQGVETEAQQRFPSFYSHKPDEGFDLTGFRS